ncbi:MAG TPA: ABC transporter permease [Bryobacteraceae bacterium]|jgi:predicted permease
MLALLRTVFFRIRGVFLARRFDAEFDHEAQIHLSLLTDRYIRQGMEPDAARCAARRQFGDLAQLKEDLRYRHAVPQLDVLLQDLGYAGRQIRKAPAFTLSAVLILALGVSASTAVFAVVNAVLLNPLPYPEPGRVASFAVADRYGMAHPGSLSYPNFFDFRAANRVFEHLVSYRDSNFSLTGSDPAIQVPGEIVAWDLFALLRVQPVLGRGFLPDEERPGTHVVVLSYDLWQSRFNSDATIIGRTTGVNGRPYTVVGVAPSGFHFPEDSPEVKLWASLSDDATVSEFTPLTAQRGARVLDAIARLKPGVTFQLAQAQMDMVAAVLVQQHPDENKNTPTTRVRPALETIVGGARKSLLTLFGAVGLLLIIACANVANLLLARNTERSREFALRAALGASRLRVVRQLLVESLLLGLMASAAGVLLAYGTLHYILPLAVNSIPRLSQATVDVRVLSFSAALALFTSMLFTMAPAIRVARTDLTDSMKQGARGIARGRDPLRASLVVAQVTLGLVLLSAAELLIGSFLHLQHRDAGIRPGGLLTFQISLPDAQYNDAQQIAFSDRLMERMRAIPGVQQAAFGMPLPLAGHQMTVSFDIVERPMKAAERPSADIAIVSPGFFPAMGIPVVAGRDFSEHDVADSPQVMIVNQAFADRYFPGEKAVGKLVEPGATNGPRGPRRREIVGIVANATQAALDQDPVPIYYFPYKQLSWGIGSIVLKTPLPPLSLLPRATTAIASLDKMAPVYGAKTMEARAYAALARPRFQMMLMTTFAVIALLLTVGGLYGVLTYSVAMRRREIGVRMALGAERLDVVGMVIREALLLVGMGLGLGTVGAIAAKRLGEALIYGFAPGLSQLTVPACTVLTLASLLAALVPAFKAARVDPMETLRSE